MADFTTTVAGLTGTPGTANGTGTAARFQQPTNAVRDTSGNIYVTDRLNNTIRKITPEGVVSTFAGAPGDGAPTFRDGTGTNARFFRPSGIAIDSSSNLYVADTNNHVIRKITSEGVVTTFAGMSGVSGSSNGTGNKASFSFPYGIATSSSNYLYVTDTGNHMIRQVTNRQVVSTIAGLTATPGATNGKQTIARFNSPTSICRGANSVFYITDTGNHTIRRVTTAGVVSTFAGLSAVAGTQDGTRVSARFNSPQGITCQLAAGAAADTVRETFYVADTNNHTIRKITQGVVTTFAGLAGNSGSANGLAAGSRFNLPQGTLAAKDGDVYILDAGNHLIRKIETQPEPTPLFCFGALFSRPRRVYNLLINVLRAETYHRYSENNDGQVDLTLFYDTNGSSAETVEITLGGTLRTTTVGTRVSFQNLDESIDNTRELTISFSEFTETLSVTISNATITYNGNTYGQGNLIPLVNLP